MWGTHLAGSPGGSREEAWRPGWGSGVGSSSGSGGPEVGKGGLSGACSIGSFSKGDSGGSKQEEESEARDDVVRLLVTTSRAQGPGLRCPHD